MTPLDYKDSKDSDQKNKKSPPRNTVRVERYFNNRFITIGQRFLQHSCVDQFLSEPWCSIRKFV